MNPVEWMSHMIAKNEEQHRRGRPPIGNGEVTEVRLGALKPKLKAEAKRQGIPLAELIRRACEKEVEK